MAGIRILVGIAGILLAGSSFSQVTVRVSLDSQGHQANAHTSTTAFASEGRFVAFDSGSSALVPGDGNHSQDVFVRDRRTGTTERVSLGTGGIEGNDDSYLVSITRDGHFVTFSSMATNLVPGDTNGKMDVFVRDRWNGTTERVSVNSLGREANDNCRGGGCSDDGRYVAFSSSAENLVEGDTNQFTDSFVRDRWTGTTERVSVSSGGGQGTWGWSDADDCTISADGRFVAFVSGLGNLVPGDNNGVPDVFVRDRVTNITERVSVSSTGGEQYYDFIDIVGGCCISPDGRFVGFNTPSPDLVPSDVNDWFDGFVHDRLTGSTVLATAGNSGEQAHNGGWVVGLSEAGRMAVIVAGADIEPGGPAGRYDTFVHDLLVGTTRRASVSSSGEPAMLDSYASSISSDGQLVAFETAAGNMVPGDTNGAFDVFVQDRLGGPFFRSHCAPGVAGVIVCPCSNPPAGPGQGCDNSSATGGAILSALGGTYLSSDSLRFTTTGEPSTALSMLLQGDALITNGAVFGQGVRCVGGTLLRRLFIEQALGGAIGVPDFQAGDSTVSARSASKGDVIQPSQSRYYLVYYRDPIVLGGCPASSTFNATQTGRVDWSP